MGPETSSDFPIVHGFTITLSSASRWNTSRNNHFWKYRIIDGYGIALCRQETETGSQRFERGKNELIERVLLGWCAHPDGGARGKCQGTSIEEEFVYKPPMNSLPV